MIRYLARCDSTPTNGLVLELNRRKDSCRHLLPVNVISKIAKLIR